MHGRWVAKEKAVEHEVKGILVVTGWNDTPLRDRIEPVCPDQMLQYAVTRGHCLVSAEHHGQARGVGRA